MTQLTNKKGTMRRKEVSLRKKEAVSSDTSLRGVPVAIGTYEAIPEFFNQSGV